MSLALRQKKTELFVILVAALIVVAWLLFYPHPAASHADLSVGTRTLHLEIADTPAAQARGLGERTTLAPDWGMLFVFSREGSYPFWMKGMKFPLDIVWLDRGVVVDVVTLQPPSSNQAPPSHLPTHIADRVIEVNAGTAAEDGFVLGALVQLPK